MHILYQQVWPSISSGSQSKLVVTDDVILFKKKTKDGAEELVNDTKGVKTMPCSEVKSVEWHPERTSIIIRGTAGKMEIPFPADSAELGNSSHRELVEALPMLGEIRREKALFIDNHVSAILSFLGYTVFAVGLFILKGRDLSSFHGRKKGFVQFLTLISDTIGIVGILGVFLFGCYSAYKKYAAREKEPVFCWISESTGNP